MLRVYVEKHWSDGSVGEMPEQVDNRFSRIDGGEDTADNPEGAGRYVTMKYLITYPTFKQ